MQLSDFPLLNSSLNALTAVLLLIGLIFIKRGQKLAHRVTMISAFGTSSVFLGCYLYYHFSLYFAHLPPVHYPRLDWTRYVYFSILIPHVILAMVMLPFILRALWFASQGEFEKHKKLTRWVWPVWMFVSVSGVLVYLMLYRFALA